MPNTTTLPLPEFVQAAEYLIEGLEKLWLNKGPIRDLDERKEWFRVAKERALNAAPVMGGEREALQDLLRFTNSESQAYSTKDPRQTGWDECAAEVRKIVEEALAATPAPTTLCEKVGITGNLMPSNSVQTTGAPTGAQHPWQEPRLTGITEQMRGAQAQTGRAERQRSDDVEFDLATAKTILDGEKVLSPALRSLARAYIYAIECLEAHVQERLAAAPGVEKRETGIFDDVRGDLAEIKTLMKV
jgi:hypothetical protein